MILVDTSVWVDHFRKSTSTLSALLEGSEVAIHPFVIGELACGTLKNRTEIPALLHALPMVPRAEDDEILFFIEKHALAGKGLGLIDVHLLASSLMCEHPLWTKDKRLKSAAEHLGMEFGQHRPERDK